MPFRFESARARWGVEDYLDALRDSNPRYVYVTRPGRGYLKLLYGPSTRDLSVLGYADPQGNVYKADGRKRGRLLGRAEEMARRPVGGIRSIGPKTVGSDPRRHHHKRGAPTFRQEAKIADKMRLLSRENRTRRPKRSREQMLAIAYRYAGVPPLPRSRRRRR